MVTSRNGFPKTEFGAGYLWVVMKEMHVSSVKVVPEQNSFKAKRLSSSYKKERSKCNSKASITDSISEKLVLSSSADINAECCLHYQSLIDAFNSLKDLVLYR